MNNQKQLIILIVITASLTSFLAGYLLTQPAKNNSAIIEQQRGALIDRFNGVVGSATSTPLPPGLLQASSDSTLAPTNASDADAVVYYHPNTGIVSKLDLETRTNTIISTASLPHLIRVIWSPNKNRVITISRTSNRFNYAYFEYTTHAHGNLGTTIKDVVFSPDSKRIALVRNGGGDSAIETADFDGKNPKTIFKTRLNNIKLFWLSDHTLAFTADDTDAGTQSLYTLTETGDLTQLVGGVIGLVVRWSPDGSKLLYSDQESGGTVLYQFDVASKQSKPLPIQTTATNCAWSLDQKKILCAVQNQGETSIVQILTANNSSSVLFSNLIITPQDVFLSHLENFLVITSATDQSLWAVKLDAR